MKKPICRGICLKKGLGQFADLRGGGIFEGFDTPMHTMVCASII